MHKKSTPQRYFVNVAAFCVLYCCFLLFNVQLLLIVCYRLTAFLSDCLCCRLGVQSPLLSIFTCCLLSLNNGFYPIVYVADYLLLFAAFCRPCGHFLSAASNRSFTRLSTFFASAVVGFCRLLRRFVVGFRYRCRPALFVFAFVGVCALCRLGVFAR